MRVLILDNYDSFVYNLAQYVGEMTDDVVVKRNDEVDIEDVRQIAPQRIIVSPGPGNPSDPRSLGVGATVIREVSRDTPTLGVCLGHEGIVHAYGGRITPAEHLRHGKTSLIKHDGRGLFKGVENPFLATRYHSFVAERKSFPSTLEVTAQSLDDHQIMGVRHKSYPIEGVQFHPESILTVVGHQIISNFLQEREK